MPKPVRVSKLQLTDWVTATLTAVLIAGSCLMIVNGRCSFRSDDSNASELSPMCVGGHLSLQSWLAITGVEFALLYTVVLPRAGQIAISKLFAHQLTNNGVKLSSLLNSLPSAPYLVALKHGKRNVMALRVCLSILATGLSISYKFSFVRVSMEGTSGSIDVTTQITGSSPDNDGNSSPISSNLEDLIIHSWESVSYHSTQPPAPFPFEMVFGPRILSGIAQLDTYDLDGFAEACFPFSYRRVRVLNDNDLSRTNPNPGDAPYASGIRFVTAPNERFVDITWINNTLYQLKGEILDNSAEDSANSIYRDIFSFSVQYCIGYVSWDVHNFDARLVNDPRDIGCVDDPFDFPSWNHSVSGFFMKNYLEAFAALDLSWSWRYTDYLDQSNSDGWSDIGLAILAPNNFLGLNVSQKARSALSDAIELPDPLYAQEACVGAGNSYWGEKYWPFAASGPDRSFEEYDNDMPFLVSGILRDDGTAMTKIGLALQAVVLLVAILVAGVILIPVLPLVTDWPAQWLSLLSGAENVSVEHDLKLSSTGRKRAAGSLLLYLKSCNDEGRSNEMPVLRLVTDKDKVSYGKLHG